MQRLLYATPTGKHPHTGYVMSMRAMELGCRSFGPRAAEDFRFSSAPVQMARTQLAQVALAGRCFLDHDHPQDGAGCEVRPYDYLLMHDDDLMLSPQPGLGNPLDVWHELMEGNPDVGVVGAVYMRERPVLPNLTVSHPTYPEEMCHVVAGIPNQPVDVAGIGTGFMMVRVSTLQALQDAEVADGAPPLFRFPLTMTRFGMVSETGEDYDFCKRVRALGQRVVADPRWKTVHFKERGPMVYDQADWEARANDFNSPEMRELAGACPRSFRLEQVRGFRVVDHVPQRELDAAAWRERARRKEAA